MESRSNQRRSLLLPQLRVRTRSGLAEYRINLGREILSQTGAILRQTLGDRSTRVALISNKKVFSLYGPQVCQSLGTNGFLVSHWLMRDGERFKSLPTTEQALRFFHEIDLDRSDAVVALGGGVVGDLAGFASAIYLRGVPLIQVPTSLLAQIDSSIGGKTGVNIWGRKNQIGSFYQPRAVIVDIATLGTLPARELAAGWFETVKQAAVAHRKLFKKTTDFLQDFNPKGIWISPKLTELIGSHISFKASIVASDEREDISRRDARSRKILNFGHTAGHALESITSYKRFRHGEAVGYGMLVAGALSKHLGLLEQSELESLIEGVRLCGPLPSANDLDENAIIEAVSHDKKRSGGHLQWVLLDRIGHPRLVDEKEISFSLLKRSLRDALKKPARKTK